MSIKSALTTYLESKTAITDIVGSGENARIYPVRRPENTGLPCIVYRRMPKDDSHAQTIDKAGGTDAPVFRLTCYAEQYGDADALGEALRQVLQGFRGTMGTVTVNACVLKDQYDGDWDAPDDGGDEGVYQDVNDYLIRYSTTIPTP